MKIEHNKIILEHGSIDIGVTEKGYDYQKYTTVCCSVEYERKDLNFYRYKDFDSLHDAYEWYKKQDLNMRGA